MDHIEDIFTLEGLVLFLTDDILPIVCVMVASQTAWYNFKDLRIIRSPKYKMLVLFSMVVCILFALDFLMVAASVDHLFGGIVEFGPTILRPVTTMTLILLNYQARGRHSISKEIIFDTVDRRHHKEDATDDHTNPNAASSGV